MGIWAIAFVLLCPQPAADSNQRVLQEIGKLEVPATADLTAGLETLYDYLDSTGGIHLRTWLEDQLSDAGVRNELKTWADQVFVEHPELLDEAGVFIDSIKKDFGGKDEPDDLWARWEQGPRKYWLLWDALERFGWDVVGVVDDGDDARTVRESLRWLAKNDDDGLALRMWLDENFKGLYSVYQSYSREEAIALLQGDYAPTLSQLLPKDAVGPDGGLKGFVLEEKTTRALLGANPLIAGVEVWGFWNPQIVAIPGVIDQTQLRHVLDHARTDLKTSGMTFHRATMAELAAAVESGVYQVPKPSSADVSALTQAAAAYANGGRIFATSWSDSRFTGKVFMVERAGTDELIVLRTYQPR